MHASGPYSQSLAQQPRIVSLRMTPLVIGICALGGATRTAITQHQARSDNISDVAAKDGSQETLVNLAALVVNLYLLPVVSGDEGLIWTLFVFMTLLHLWANYREIGRAHV